MRELADELLKESKETSKSIGLKYPKMLERKWIIFIINKHPECSDTWEIENSVKKEFNRITKCGVKHAKKIGIKTEEDVAEIVHKYRKIK